MQKYLNLLQKAWTILVFRVRTQGVYTTLLWLHGRGVPYLTGVPLLQYSRVTPNLYVGPQFREPGKRLLEAQGIEACVNMRIEKDDAQCGLALKNYLYLPTVDDDAPSIEHLDQGVTFIRDTILAGGKVYIHCGAGVGRAPSMAAAYLIAEGLSLDEALVKIRKVRPFITITPPQMQQLQLYEQRCRGSNQEGLPANAA
jgi:protein-tyrosine phosphatase